jgi:tRNA(Ile)-lysidine synthase TilS/MesJ
VKDIASSYGIEYFARELPFSLQKNFSQEIGRQWRQKECQSILSSFPKVQGKEKYIATAHHLDDQVETLLLKLIRGTHITRFQSVRFFFFYKIFDFFYLIYHFVLDG